MFQFFLLLNLNLLQLCVGLTVFILCTSSNQSYCTHFDSSTAFIFFSSFI